MQTAMPIEVKNLTHTYSEGSAFQSTAIREVSLTIADGEFLAVVGHTGSGKSTLVQHLNGLLKPTSGQVLIDGVVPYFKKYVFHAASEARFTLASLGNDAGAYGAFKLALDAFAGK